MSNDLIKSIQSNLTYIKGVDEQTRAVAGAGGGSKRISIKGGVFRKIVGGKEVGAIEARHMNVIFARMAPNPSRQFYTGRYVEGQSSAPMCWSTDSKTPDDDVESPQARTCDSCPQSVKGSGQGGQGTACRLSWRTAVVLPDDPSGDIMQLVLPATSSFGKEEDGKWPFRPYMQMLANHNISGSSVITKMQFDTKSPVPRVLFSPVAAVTEEVLNIVNKQGQSSFADNAVKLTVFKVDSSEAPGPALAPELSRRPLGNTVIDGMTTHQAAEAEEVAEVIEEPVLRETKKPLGEGADIPDVVRKWSKKKG
jgi:hypothetical protein